MYQPKDKSYGIVAVIYYLVYYIGLFMAGILYQNGFRFGMNIIYCLLFVLGISIALIKDRNICVLGFSKECSKRNLIISIIIVVAAFLIIWIVSDLPLGNLMLQMLYNLLYIAAIEEILFRGLIQNYLFGFKLNKYVIHAIPNLIETFISHFIFCFIAYKSKDITISIALHYAYNFLGVIM